MHIRNIYEEGELVPEATVKKFLTVRQEGSRQVRRELEYYNLDMIISVGYRVKSLIVTRFRILATQRLREYIIKGFMLDDERLKQAGGGGILKNFWPASVIFVHPKKFFGARFWTFMPPASIMIPVQTSQGSFSK